MKLIFIHGPPASGKLTIAKALQGLVSARLCDNHAAIDFAKTVFDFGTLGFWELVHAVRLKALDLAGQHHIPLLIYTSCYSEPEDRPLFEQLEVTVASHGGIILPVFLDCAQAVLEERVGNTDRVERGKTVSVEGLRQFNNQWNLVPVPRENCLCLDSDRDTPEAVAARIVYHFGLS